MPPHLKANQYPLKEKTYQIIGASMDVHNEMGHGFFEGVYQEALEIELSLRNIPFVAQKKFEVEYKGHILSKKYIPDFICFEEIIVEIKAISNMTRADSAQVLNALKATGLKVGLGVNFGKPKLQYERFVW
jgi:GxxExxY protein